MKFGKAGAKPRIATGRGAKPHCAIIVVQLRQRNITGDLTEVHRGKSRGTWGDAPQLH